MLTIPQIQIMKDYRDALQRMEATGQNVKTDLEAVREEIRAALQHPMGSSTYASTHKGQYCPFCRGCAFEGKSYEPAGDNLTQMLYCHECGRSWIDKWKLVGYMPIAEDPTSEEAP